MNRLAVTTPPVTKTSAATPITAASIIFAELSSPLSTPVFGKLGKGFSGCTAGIAGARRTEFFAVMVVAGSISSLCVGVAVSCFSSNIHTYQSQFLLPASQNMTRYLEEEPVPASSLPLHVLQLQRFFSNHIF